MTGTQSDFFREITEQPAVLATTLNTYLGKTGHALDDAVALFAPGRTVVLTGMGSSYYASLAGSLFLSHRRFFSCVKDASELLHYELEALPPDGVLIGVSQSGESIETRQVVERLSGLMPMITITNHPESTLGKLGRVVLPLFAGQETCVATKTYVTTLLVLYLLALRSREETLAAHTRELRQCFQKLVKVVDSAKNALPRLSAFCAGASRLTLVGRGPVFASLLHGALVIKETSGTAVEAIDGGTFRHGPLELAGDGHTAIIAAPHGQTQHLSLQLAKELASYGSRVILLTDAPVPETEHLLVLRLPVVTEELAPLLYVAPLELLAWQVAQDCGADPDAPRFTSKVTRSE